MSESLSKWDKEKIREDVDRIFQSKSFAKKFKRMVKKCPYHISTPLGAAMIINSKGELTDIRAAEVYREAIKLIKKQEDGSHEASNKDLETLDRMFFLPLGTCKRVYDYAMRFYPLFSELETGPYGNDRAKNDYFFSRLNRRIAMDTKPKINNQEAKHDSLDS